LGREKEIISKDTGRVQDFFVVDQIAVGKDKVVLTEAR